MKSVLFICTSNLCRSPLAAALFTLSIQQDADFSQWRVSSAGTWAKPGLPVPQHLQKHAARHGLDLSQHRSQVVNRDLLQQYALLLVMEPGHREALGIEFPDQAQKLHLISEMAGLVLPLADPVGSDEAEVEQVIKTLQSWLTAGKDRIRDLAG
jgi:protein-tyrosine phosphatase